ncbi:hypothetical protein [Aerolutibacter ruishenii]|uniref:TnsA endonuclease-like protein n=1 Tax=Aerolutibacter ruishenii TaxID=686800 RepID=A0A562LDV8_9GAMM|nr:hypothetical protein [Lysobacter ruishenii]TWI05725.1 hypothetical protein IP93_03014 [Lysobacter ruishenii]
MHTTLDANQLRAALTAARFPDHCNIRRIEHDRRVIPVSRGRHVRGWHPIRPDHPTVAFESKLECRLLTALVRFAELRSVVSQPVTVSYTVDGTSHRYTPDFLVEFANVPDTLTWLGFTRRTYVEVKPLRRALNVEATLRRQFPVLRQAMQTAVTLITDWDLTLSNWEVCHDA